jgi:hypothetical protein
LDGQVYGVEDPTVAYDAAGAAAAVSVSSIGAITPDDVDAKITTEHDTERAHQGSTYAPVFVVDAATYGDGVTDATAHIQAKIDSLPLHTADPVVLSPSGFANGGTVHLPRGRYKVTGTLNLRRGVHLTGESRESSQILSFTAGSVLQYVDAGRYIQDEIVIENLSIWQDTSVAATSGAGIELIDGPTYNASTAAILRNIYIEGTYRGVHLSAGIWSSIDNVDVSKAVSDGCFIEYITSSTTSTTFKNCYANQCGGSGYHITGSAYCSFVGCASDSNTQYGYFIDGGSGHSLFGCGAEENTICGVYLKNTSGVLVNVSVQYGSSTGTRHGIMLEVANGTLILGGYANSDLATGYGVYQVTAGGTTTCAGMVFTGNFATAHSNFIYKFLNLSDANGLVGATNSWGIGTTQQPDPLAVLNVGGIAGTGSNSGLKTNVTFTGTSAMNSAIYAQMITANTAVTYPLVVGVFVPAASKGAASTITRSAGLYVDETATGGTANAAVMINAGAGTVPAGNWALYSDSARDSVLKGPLRMGSATGPKWSSGTGTPEAAVTAPVGSLFSRTDGGAVTTLYVKESGTGNTGWVAK